MRVLQLHCDKIEYTPTKKEISSAEDIEPKTVRLEEIVVCFIAIEKDDKNGNYLNKNAHFFLIRKLSRLKNLPEDKFTAFPFFQRCDLCTKA